MDKQEIKMFKVLKGFGRDHLKNMPSGIPWDMLNEEQAKHNHSQTLTRLNERGGMCVSEILANIYKQSNRDWTVTQETVDELNKLVSDFLKPQEVPQVKTVEEIFNLMVDECPFEMHEMTTKPYIIEAMELYAKQFQSRIEELEKQKDDLELMFETRKELDMEILKFQRDKIAELEASNDKYREALDSILSEVNHSEQDKDAALNNIYELAGKALNSKEVGNG